MNTSSWIILVIIAFFALVVHAIHLEDQRKGERRKLNLPHPVERRKGSRRKGGFVAYTGWALRLNKARRRNRPEVKG